MFLVTPFPNLVYALDLSQPGAPLKWQYDPKPLAAARGVACCDVVNRGAAFWNGLVIFNTLDGRTIALDAETGAERWSTQLADINRGETMTMAPLAAAGKVFVGNSGGEFGVRGWLAALNASDGSLAWRAYSTGPDKDVLIGGDFKPFYAQDRGTDLGVSSWQPDGWKTGGGTVWGWMSYDPELNLLYYGYYGTANIGANVVYKPGPGGHQGEVTAWDPAAGRAVWKIREKYPAWSGTLATAGGLVFYGTMEGWFKAVDARSGQVVWQFKTGSGIIGQPITYRGPDGHQYVAVFSGVGGWPGSVVVNDLDTNDHTASAGWGMYGVPAI